MTELKQARNEINAIDKEMAKLFEKRMEVCARVAAYKQSVGLSIRDTERETELINRNREFINDAEINSYYIRFIRGVIDLSCAYQLRIMEGLKVICCGGDGKGITAARSMFPEARLIETASAEEAYNAVTSGEPDIAVLPLEDEQTASLLFDGELFVNQVTDVEVNGEKRRFAALSRVKNAPLSNRKREDENFILMFTVQNETGALAQVLNIIGAHGYNLRSLRSYHRRELLWNHFFYLEAEGSVETSDGRELMQELSALCARLKLVGTYYSNNTV